VIHPPAHRSSSCGRDLFSAVRAARWRR
jgi:hypothetical protein